MTAIPAESEELDYRPSYRAASIAATLIFIIYLVTLSPTTAMWDTSEYIAAAYTLGLPHPPGNPFFILIGRFFAILPIAPNVAMIDTGTEILGINVDQPLRRKMKTTKITSPMERIMLRWASRIESFVLMVRSLEIVKRTVGGS